MINEKPSKKNISVNTVVKLMRGYKKSGKVVGCLSGSFDLMAAVNFKALEERAKKCDVLIVLLNSDTSIKTYKGKNRPILNQNERSFIVAQSPFVNHIIIFSEVTPILVLEKIKPDIFFNVNEWGIDCIEKSTVEKNGGKVLTFDFPIPKDWCQSTTDLVNRIIKSNSINTNKVIFLDRDGVINENKSGYLYKWKDISFTKYLFETLRSFIKAGYKLIILTNQSGISRGYYSNKDVEVLHKKMINEFKKNDILIEDIYYCPHDPKSNCSCRKPGIDMLLKAAEEHNINLSKSWFIGDSHTDIEAGRNCNVKTVFLGKEKNYPKEAIRPNFFANNIKTAKSYILK